MDSRLQALGRTARKLDRNDPLKHFRKRFRMPPGKIYLDGNSLGLLCRNAEATLKQTLHAWRDLAIGGWLEAERPWFTLAETLGARCAALVGAGPDEVVMSGTTTVNIHALVQTFYHPEGRRTRILAGGLDFPSDIYALKSILRLRGFDPGEHLVLVPSRNGHTLEEDDIVRLMDERTALVFLPSVLYRSGQLLNMERLAGRARERGLPIGFDCAHSVGAVPHELSKWGVDFAVWCGYKYLNGGPGSTAFLYLNRAHFGREPALAGWFGSIKERQFDMSLDFEPARSAGGWQISSPSILSAAPLIGSLGIFEEAGMTAVREKSLALTRFLMDAVDELLAPEDFGFSVITPRANESRGGHVALAHPEAMRISEALRARGVVPDFRPPDIVRIAPVAFYNTHTELRRLVVHLRDIVESREYEKFPTVRPPIS